MNSSGIPSPAEQHLGDRLAALVDGELGHDMRERVLAHLATCCRCKAEADAQRRLKSVFAETAPPPPSEGLLARLQGLPGGDDGPGDLGKGGRTGRFGDGVFGMSPEGFGYAPSGPHRSVLPGGDRGRGFRIHDMGAAERSASRGRRFAFAAAGAVSLAAIALGGALPLNATGGPTARSSESAGFKVTPRSWTAPQVGVVNEQAGRRGGAGSVSTAIGNETGAAVAAGTPAPTDPLLTPLSHLFTMPLLTGIGSPPLIRTTAVEETSPRPTPALPLLAPARLAASSQPDAAIPSAP